MSNSSVYITGDTIMLTAEFKKITKKLKKAELTTPLGGNADLKFVAVKEGEGGNGISVEYKDPGIYGLEDKPEEVGGNIISPFDDREIKCEVEGKAIVVTLARKRAKQAYIDTELEGDNNDIRYTAVTAGVTGNKISVEYIHPTTINQALAVSVATADGVNDITVRLATDSTGQITSTSSNVIKAINQHVTARTLVSAIGKEGDAVDGLVRPMGRIYLTYGSDAYTTSTAGDVARAIGENAEATALVTIEYPETSSGGALVEEMAATHLSTGSDDPDYIDIETESIKIYDKWENLLFYILGTPTEAEVAKGITSYNHTPTRKDTGKYEVLCPVPLKYTQIIQEWNCTYEGAAVEHRRKINLTWAEDSSQTTPSTT